MGNKKILGNENILFEYTGREFLSFATGWVFEMQMVKSITLPIFNFITSTKCFQLVCNMTEWIGDT